jgi:hypothetical protein
MSLCPNTVASGGQPLDLYFPLVENLPPAQILSQAGNTISLSGGGGSVNVASTTSVASSAQKTTAITYNTGLLETNVAGALNIGLGSAIGSTRALGGNVVISRTDAPPALEFTSGANTATIVYDASGSIFAESSLTTNASELKVSTGPTAGVGIGTSTTGNISYISGKGDPLFVGENGQTSYSGLFLGNGTNPSDFLILDRKDNTNVANTAASISMTGAGIINIDSQLATGGIGISTNGANITVSSGLDISVTAATDINIQAATSATAQISIGTSNTVFNMDEATGGITLTAPNSLNLTASIGDLVLTGTNIQSATATGASGQYLRIKLNGTFYKILLEND